MSTFHFDIYQARRGILILLHSKALDEVDIRYSLTIPIPSLVRTSWNQVSWTHVKL